MGLSGILGLASILPNFRISATIAIYSNRCIVNGTPSTLGASTTTIPMPGTWKVGILTPTFQVQDETLLPPADLMLIIPHAYIQLYRSSASNLYITFLDNVIQVSGTSNIPTITALLFNWDAV